MAEAEKKKKGIWSRGIFLPGSVGGALEFLVG